jgi:peptide-methionine (S)-S-oxide reductase
MTDRIALQKATLGGGCFWCLQPLFQSLRGVHAAVVGYAGGHIPNPTYHQVCSGTTGDAEVVQVTFDPALLSFRELLEVFFSIHDPTTLNRQGADSGTQYRSTILFHDPEQKQTAEALISRLNQESYQGKPIVTLVAPLDEFYPAEDYHQGYYEKNPYAGYCQMVIRPKVVSFSERFGSKMKEQIEPHKV